VSVASSIFGSSAPYDFTHVKPLKDRLSKGQADEGTPVEAPSADLLRMIQGLMAPSASSKQETDNRADNDPGNIYAEIQVNGKTVATIYNSGAAETSNAIARKAKLSGDRSNGSEGPELAQRRAEDLAAAAGGEIVKADSAIDQAQWLAQQAGTPGASQGPAAPETQRGYSDVQDRQTIANPSMLLQAQLFAQQGFETKAALQYVPPLDDRMSSTGASV